MRYTRRKDEERRENMPINGIFGMVPSLEIKRDLETTTFIWSFILGIRTEAPRQVGHAEAA